MAPKTHELTVERLRELLNYDSLTGIFTRKINRSGGGMAGVIAGWNGKKKYKYIKIDGKTYFSHRLAWLYVFGCFPECQIDHIDLNKSNNKINNLRKSSNSDNKANSRKYKNNTCGLKGVSFHKLTNKFQSRIQKNKIRINLGLFDTPEEAHAVYCLKANELFGEFANFG